MMGSKSVKSAANLLEFLSDPEKAKKALDTHLAAMEVHYKAKHEADAAHAALATKEEELAGREAALSAKEAEVARLKATYDQGNENLNAQVKAHAQREVDFVTNKEAALFDLRASRANHEQWIEATKAEIHALKAKAESAAQAVRAALDQREQELKAKLAAATQRSLDLQQWQKDLEAKAKDLAAKTEALKAHLTGL